jgi:hypothetical protein
MACIWPMAWPSHSVSANAVQHGCTKPTSAKKTQPKSSAPAAFLRLATARDRDALGSRLSAAFLFLIR